MTETIGWGDVDVDVTPPHRRRLRALLLWSALLAVIAGIALAPTARSRLADGAVASLVRAWSSAQTYDESRTALESRALQRAAPGDRSMYVRLVTALDKEEASRLRGIARDVRNGHTWTSDVHAAATRVDRALLAEAHDLDVDAGRTGVTFSSDLYLETPTQYTTQSLLLAAQGSIEQLSRRHHIRMQTHARAGTGRLTSADAVLARLDQLTDKPLDLRLAVSHDGTLDVWDLATGTGHRDVAAGAENPDYTQPLLPLGSGVLFAAQDGSRLVNADGSSRRLRLPTRAEYLPAGDGSLWVATNGTWRHYDRTGRPTGPSYAGPAGFYGGAMAATADSLVFPQDLPAMGVRAAVWTPSTGRLRPVGRACYGAVTGARAAIAFVGCDQLQLGVMDVKTGRLRTVHAPAGTVVDEVAMALSPDGSELAFRASPLDGDDISASLALLDVRTGKLSVIGHGAIPLSWSEDGTTLLISNDVGGSPYSLPLGYWRSGMDRPEPIRIALTSQSMSALLLPEVS